ncbi:hypothetical protein Mal64_11080 [Pseudobythopirellula maris]|uniref:Cytidyltransferase-like domain-containing protein n=1 Tax=Pseudobythopirellula maris TaxID=2527991 RepID=A0A5C5ZWQ2_9BACT|nr:hypothetical protein [Pseudobythopirellula maris]TWT90713.1 hypothetical protein Mal64_11080 [Pseudobythopirellula maris]
MSEPAPQHAADLQRSAIERLHASPWCGVLSVTGGGATALGRLLAVPGASATVIEAVVPYAERSLAEWLGAAPPQASNDTTARAMAMRSLQRAIALTEDATEHLFGLGATASLTTGRPKRGEHRVCIAVQTLKQTVAMRLDLEKGARNRDEEEAVASHAIVALLADAVGLAAIDIAKTPPGVEVKVERSGEHPDWGDLISGRSDCVTIGASCKKPAALFPGSFNPPHQGHRGMADLARRRLGAAPLYELSVTNAEKPPLDFLELEKRVALVDAPMLLTNAPTFVEKARLTPGAVLLVGADTLERIAQPRFYTDGKEGRDRAIAEIDSVGCRFLAFGRTADGSFVGADDLRLPPALRAICDAVQESEFRYDQSSTAVREQTQS